MMTDQVESNLQNHLSSIIQKNLGEHECCICLSAKDMTIVFNCQHHLCLSCFKQYATTNLNYRQFKYDPNLGYTLGCPGGCPNSLLKELHIFRLMDRNNYEKYKNFAAEEYVFYHDGILCPSPSCGSGLIPAEGNIRVMCPASIGCGKVFCRSCRAEWADPASDVCPCQKAPAQQEYRTYSLWRRMFGIPGNASELKIKKCPSCRVYTEKDGGCNAIACTQCGMTWCWICEKEFRSDCIQSHWF